MTPESDWSPRRTHLTVWGTLTIAVASFGASITFINLAWEAGVLS